MKRSLGKLCCVLREAGAVSAIQGDSAKLRTPAPSSAEPQPSCGARRPQRLAWRTCSWAAGRVLCTPRQTKGFAHLALQHMRVLWRLGFIPVGSPIPWTFSPLVVEGRPWGQAGLLAMWGRAGLPAACAAARAAPSRCRGRTAARAAGCPWHAQGGAGRQVGICREAFSAWCWARPWQVHLQFN